MAIDMNLYTYWQDAAGTQTPPIISLCLESLRRQNPEIVVLDDQKVLEMGGSEPIALTKGRSIVRRSDMIRLWLLIQFGGAWIDADSICLQPIPLLKHLHGKTEFVVRIANGLGHITNNAIASRPYGNFVTRAYDEAKAMLGSKESLPYTALGPTLFTRIYQTSSALRHTMWVLPERLFQPIHWRLTDVYKEAHGPMEWHRFWAPAAATYHLCGKTINHYADWSKRQLMSSQHLISFLFRKATGDVVPRRAKEVLNRLPMFTPLVGVEVGVDKGVFSRVVLQQRPCLTLHLIDPWAPNPDPHYAATKDLRSRPEWNHARSFAQAVKNVAPFGTRAVFHRTTSREAVDLFADGSLDFVFIDADHSKEGCAEDIRIWSPKVKPGGLLCGHDYDFPKEKFDFGVKEAVDEFIAATGKNLETGEDWTWLTRM